MPQLQITALLCLSYDGFCTPKPPSPSRNNRRQPIVDSHRLPICNRLPCRLTSCDQGVQCAEDALLAAERGLDGIVCSNHGGRQLDTSRSGVEVLVEVMAALRERGLQDRLEVYVDGGVRRGTDVLKALALGAKAVGIGRPTLYAMAGYGTAGVERVFEVGTRCTRDSGGQGASWSRGSDADGARDAYSCGAGAVGGGGDTEYGESRRV